MIMPLSLVPSFLFFCFINGISPGPANLCSLSAGINYGPKRALVQWRGLFTGFAIDSLVSALLIYFLGSVLGQYVRVLSFVGAAYLIWLAWHIWRSTDVGDADPEKSCSFMTGLLLNLTNIKVYTFCLTALGSFVLPYNRTLPGLLAVGMFLPFTGPLCNLVWIFAGTKLRSIFRSHRRLVNGIMAVSLVLCAVSLVR